MARKASPVGRFARGLIEDAPIDLILGIFKARGRENDSEPDFGLAGVLENETEETRGTAFLRPLASSTRTTLYQQSSGVDGCGTWPKARGGASLDTIAEKCLFDEEYIEYEKQLDPLCRSIWTFINVRHAFEDAESFYFARQYRDHGKMYDAFEVELGNATGFDADSVDEAALEARITEVLELKTNCTVTAMDLPATGTHPASVMLIVRHGEKLYGKRPAKRRNPAMTDWTIDRVKDRLELAAEVMRQAPGVKPQGYFSAWPEYFHSFADKVGQKPRMRRPLPSPRMITEADETML